MSENFENSNLIQLDYSEEMKTSFRDYAVADKIVGCTQPRRVAALNVAKGKFWSDLALQNPF